MPRWRSPYASRRSWPSQAKTWTSIHPKCTQCTTFYMLVELPALSNIVHTLGYHRHWEARIWRNSQLRPSPLRQNWTGVLEILSSIYFVLHKLYRPCQRTKLLRDVALVSNKFYWNISFVLLWGKWMKDMRMCSPFCGMHHHSQGRV